MAQENIFGVPIPINIAGATLVNKGGSDSTGVAGSAEHAFLTIQAAITAAKALTPTTAARQLVKVLPGTYNEQIILESFVDLDFSDGAILISNTVNTNQRLVYDNALTVDCSITGYGVFRTGVGFSGAVIRIEGPGSKLILKCREITASDEAECLEAGNGSTLDATVNIAQCDGEIPVVLGNASSTVILRGGFFHNVKASPDFAGGLSLNDAGQVYDVHVKIDSTGGEALECAGANTIDLFGNCVFDTAGSYSVGNGTIRINGETVSNVGPGALTEQIGTTTVDANVSL